MKWRHLISAFTTTATNSNPTHPACQEHKNKPHSTWLQFCPAADAASAERSVFVSGILYEPHKYHRANEATSKITVCCFCADDVPLSNKQLRNKQANCFCEGKTVLDLAVAYGDLRVYGIIKDEWKSLQPKTKSLQPKTKTSKSGSVTAAVQ